MNGSRIVLISLAISWVFSGCSSGNGGKTCTGDQDCPENQYCSPYGICQEKGGCPTGQVMCGTICVDLVSNDDHCGACDAACSVYAFCIDGVCACIQGYSLCLEECINLGWDSDNCGECGNECSAGQVCSQGDCLGNTTCEELGLATCGSICVDLQSDPGHCGVCHNACGSAESCVDGVCQAETSCEDHGLVTCGDQCADLDNDPSHCGACNHWCSGFTCCAGLCANLNNDILNCASCGYKCSEDLPYCDQGVCSTPPCADDVYCDPGETCCDIHCCSEDQLCCTVPGPVGSTTSCSEAFAETCSTGCVECVCLSPDTPVATPSGYRSIASLRAGDLVYSLHNWSIRAVPILHTNRTPVNDHRVVRVSFENGVTIEVSRGHPTADGRTFAVLGAGDIIGGVGIASITTIDYRHSHTYDILPDSDTGSYFAAGIRIGSTIER